MLKQKNNTKLHLTSDLGVKDNKKLSERCKLRVGRVCLFNFEAVRRIYKSCAAATAPVVARVVHTPIIIIIIGLLLPDFPTH